MRDSVREGPVPVFFFLLFFFLLFKTDAKIEQVTMVVCRRMSFFKLRGAKNLSDFGDDAELTNLLDLCEDCQLLTEATTLKCDICLK